MSIFTTLDILVLGNRSDKKKWIIIQGSTFVRKGENKRILGK